MKIGLAIAMRREELNKTQEEVAAFVGVSKSCVCRWENGDIQSIKSDKIKKLAEILQVSPAMLLLDEVDSLSLSTKDIQPFIMHKGENTKLQTLIASLSDNEAVELHAYLKFLLWKRNNPD